MKQELQAVFESEYVRGIKIWRYGVSNRLPYLLAFVAITGSGKEEPESLVWSLA
jgi:hypothetical protein